MVLLPRVAPRSARSWVLGRTGRDGTKKGMYLEVACSTISICRITYRFTSSLDCTYLPGGTGVSSSNGPRISV